jgi:hypothetical protein
MPVSWKRKENVALNPKQIVYKHIHLEKEHSPGVPSLDHSWGLGDTLLVALFF